MLQKLLFILCISVSLLACSTYGDRVSPVPLPTQQKDHVNVEGALLLANAYVDPDAAETAFGFNIRGAGLLPVRVVVDNQSAGDVELLGDQTFLIDKQGQAWPLLTAKQANERVKDRVQVAETFLGTGVPAVLMGAAGAVAGVAIGVLTGDNLGEAAMKGAVLGGATGAIYGGATRHEEIEDDIEYDLARHSMRNQHITAGSLAYGYLFFPGNEIESVQSLRLSIAVNGQKRVVNINLPSMK